MKKQSSVVMTHSLSEFVNSVTEANRRSAMTAYLESQRHQECLMAGMFAKLCDQSTRNLKRGKIAPRLDISCCDDSFTIILSSNLGISFEGVSLPDDFDEDGEPTSEEGLDHVLEQWEYARLVKLSGTRLMEVLEQEFGCRTTTFISVHEKDRAVQKAYYAAVIRRFRAAAEYAVAIGSSAASLWMEAIRLLQPNTLSGPSCVVPHDHACDLDLREEDVRAAWETAAKAQAQLWVDNALRDLKPPTVRKSHKMGH